MPAGRSGHLELGYIIGLGKRGYILFDVEPERYDVMYQFAQGVAFSLDELCKMLKDNRKISLTTSRLWNILSKCKRLWLGK